MTPEHQKILEDNRKFYISLTGPAQMLKGLSSYEKDGLLRVARAEFFGPGYSPDMFCPPCISEFIINTYRAYDKWLEGQAITVAANFPSNKD